MTEQELMMKHQKRRDRIKNIAILFLTIMLLLTFFSNTIMNYSLAEVGTAYASHGPLTTKIRGDGYVEAKDPIQVTTDKESEVLKVFVKDGDKVKKGQTLFLLEGTTVDELKQAQTDLMNLNYEYAKSLLEITVPNYDENNLEIKYAQKDLRKALKAIEDTREDIQKKKGEYKELKQKMKAAKKDMDIAKDDVDNKTNVKIEKEQEIAKIDMQLETYENEKTVLTNGTQASNQDIREKKKAVKAAERVASDAQTAWEEAGKAEEEFATSGSNETIKTIEGQIKEQKKVVTKAQRDLETLRNNLTKAQKLKIESEKLTTINDNINLIAADIDIVTKIDNKNVEISRKEAQIATEGDDVKKKQYEEELKQLRNELSELSKKELSGIVKNPTLSNLQSKYTELFNSMQEEKNEIYSSNMEKLKEAQNAVSDQEILFTEENQTLAELQSDLLSAESKKQMLTAAKAKTAECESAKKSADNALKEAQRALEDAQSAVEEVDAASLETLEKTIKTVKEKKIDLDNQKTQADIDLQRTETVYAESQEAYNTAKAAVDSFQKVDENAMDTVNQAADEKRKALEALYNTLSKTQADNSLTQQKSDLDSQQKQEEIKRKKKEIARLKKKKLPVKLKAKQAGVVGSVTIKVGEKTTANTPLAEITVKKNGFKLSIPVTMDQSKQVKRGDNASVLNIWDGDVKAILSEIKTDPSNPNAGRTLVFDVSGDVENGTSLSISIGERTANYDLIVPTSAIREDSDGKFILRIEEKSSPVGNRYIARKEAVTIITQDETQSAVTASFDSYTSIITTSSKSVEPGDYVRLAS